MKDSCSSEEEIVKRRRFRTPKRDLRSLFDEERPEESSEDVNVDERSTLFNEIFGTGKEYLYILEDEEEESEEVVEEARELSPEDCKRYVEWNLDVEMEDLEGFVGLLLKGYGLHYVMLDDVDYGIDIYTGMKIEESVKEYKAFVEAKSKYKTPYIGDVYSWEGLKYIPKYEEIKKGYKSSGRNDQLLTVEEFEENLKARQLVHKVHSDDEHLFDEVEYVHQLSTSLLVRDYLVQLGKIYGEIPEEKVFRFYNPECQGKAREIILKVIQTINIVYTSTSYVLFDRVVDRIYNGALRRLTSEEKVVSCTRDQGAIKGVVLDHKGFVLKKFKKSRKELEGFLDEVRPYCILLSGFSPSIRLVMQSLIGRNCLYVENSLFKGEKDKYEFCAGIGRQALFPEIEYIRHYKRGGGYGYILKEDEEVNVDRDLVKKAILTSISMTGIDLNLLLSQPDKVDLLSFLGLNVNSNVKDGKPYLRHFKEYTQIECNEVDNDTPPPPPYRPEFGGFPDSVAFENLSGSFPGILGSTLEGRVFHVDEGYVLVSVLNNVTVFVRTQAPHFPNQMVKVRVLEANEAFVSFNGEMCEETPRLKYPRFCKHPLYREMDSKASEDYLRETQGLILLRRSSRDNSPILVFNFYQGIYLHLKLTPDLGFRDRLYSSVDEAISLLVKPILRNVQDISRHRHFYESEEKVDLGGDSSFIRYAFYFPKEYPGRLCFIFKSQGVINREYLGVYETLSYKGETFETLDDFLAYRKRI